LSFYVVFYIQYLLTSLASASTSQKRMCLNYGNNFLSHHLRHTDLYHNHGKPGLTSLVTMVTWCDSLSHLIRAKALNQIYDILVHKVRNATYFKFKPTSARQKL
jgi:hypothetical protein